jgi:hypothetical protein
MHGPGNIKEISFVCFANSKTGVWSHLIFLEKGYTDEKCLENPTLDITVLLYLLETTAGVGGVLSLKITVGQLYRNISIFSEEYSHLSPPGVMTMSSVQLGDRQMKPISRFRQRALTTEHDSSEPLPRTYRPHMSIRFFFYQQGAASLVSSAASGVTDHTSSVGTL